VADALSDDGTRDIVEAFHRRDARVSMVDNHRRIVPSAFNTALAAAKSDVFIRLDAHTKYADDYIVQGLIVLKETGADGVGGPCLTAAKGYFQEANSLAFLSRWVTGAATYRDPDFEGEADAVVYGFWRRAVLERLGGMDEEMVRSEDDELNLRITSSGGRFWQSPRVRSWYYPRSRPMDLIRQFLQYGYWKVLLMQKHKRVLSPVHLMPGAFVFAVLAGVILSFLWIPLLWLSLAALGAYLAFAIAASMAICYPRKHRQYLPVMPLIIACYHIPYGIGFWFGILDFLVLRHRGGRSWTGRITR